MIKKIKINAYILLIIFTPLLLSSQPEAGMPSEPGKCFAKCLIQAVYKERILSIPIYIGNDTLIENLYVKDTSILIQDESTSWEKRIDKEGEKIWCLIENDDKLDKIEWFLTDTTKTKDFIYQNILIERILIKEGDYTEWKEVICENDITVNFVTEIQMLLIENDYILDFKEPTGKFCNKTKSGLVKYQQSNNLPVGQLDIETLNLMEIEF